MDAPIYCVPLGRSLTAAEHAEHLAAHAQLARHLASIEPGEGKQYHEANAATFAFAARIVRVLDQHGAGLRDLIALHGVDHHAFSCAKRLPGHGCDCDYKPLNAAGAALHELVVGMGVSS